jgi:hypothetical protein
MAVMSRLQSGGVLAQPRRHRNATSFLHKALIRSRAQINGHQGDPKRVKRKTIPPSCGFVPKNVDWRPSMTLPDSARPFFCSFAEHDTAIKSSRLRSILQRSFRLSYFMVSYGHCGTVKSSSGDRHCLPFRISHDTQKPPSEQV